MSTCPHPRCDVDVARGMLACKPHWFALPKPLRDAINSTWRNRRRDGLGPWSENVIEARRLWAAESLSSRKVDRTPVRCIFCDQVDEPDQHEDSKCPGAQPVRVEHHLVDTTSRRCGCCAQQTILLDDGLCVICSPPRAVDDARYDVPEDGALR